MNLNWLDPYKQSKTSPWFIQACLTHKILIAWQRMIPKMHYLEKRPLPWCPQASCSESVCWLLKIKFFEPWLFQKGWCLSSSDSQRKAGVPRHHRGTKEKELGADCEYHLWVYSATDPALHQAACIPTGEGQWLYWEGLGVQTRARDVHIFILEAQLMRSLLHPHPTNVFKLQKPIHTQPKNLNLGLNSFEM